MFVALFVAIVSNLERVVMEVSIGFDGFMKAKEAKGVRIFIFLLGDEFSHLDNESSWIRYSKVQIQLVRLDQDEFRMLDIGIHPKIIFFRNGREFKEINGIPSVTKFRSLLHKL